MPKYRYGCDNCGEIVYIYHHINDISTDCEKCNSENCLTKLPTIFRTQRKEIQLEKTGDKVKNAIRQYSKDLKEEKKRLKELAWEEDE